MSGGGIVQKLRRQRVIVHAEAGHAGHSAPVGDQDPAARRLKGALQHALHRKLNVFKGRRGAPSDPSAPPRPGWL
jgi:hypothetical protein